MKFTKTNFKRNISSVESAFVEGNNFWFDAAQYGHDQDQNLHVKFAWGGKNMTLTEEVGVTNGGASWRSVTVECEGSVIYYDSSHDGRGAWQTGDDAESAHEYSSLTNYMLRFFRGYVK